MNIVESKVMQNFIDLVKESVAVELENVQC